MTKKAKFKATRIEEMARRCRSIVHIHAAASAGAMAVPVPGLNAAIDAVTLFSMTNRILAHFDLRQDQIGMVRIKKKAALLRLLRQNGCHLVGRQLTQRSVLKLVTKMGRVFAIGRLARYVPGVGRLAAAVIAYAAAWKLGSIVIAECVSIRRSLAAAGH
jgi:hypothetical protein